ncbi:HD domain-containing protein [Haloplanus pelagicus]|jgi:hypothetical protein|uniref:HD domain-containing protein n=1 Tax=Haloplanus pelagicus TaxID=2949995 RepID=UPI00203D629D|nr:hypothetical protein [Haloplanus sp. HW8-1]
MNQTEDDVRRWLSGVFGDTQIADRVVTFHESFMSVYGNRYRTLVEEIKEGLEEIPAHNRYFNDHGSRHTERIFGNITLLMIEYDIELNETEKFLLAAASWLHDIGMSINEKISTSQISIGEDTRTEWFHEIGTTEEEDRTIDDDDLIRKWHHILSWNFVRNNADRLGLDDYYLSKYIAELCRAHRRRADTTRVEESVVVDESSVRHEVALRDLAALLQFADALDIGKERAPEISSYLQSLPEESQKHWKVCQLITGIELDGVDRQLTIKAHHSSERERHLLEMKAEHLYDEYKDIEEIIAGEPFKFHLTDIVVESDHRTAVDHSIRISGREQHLERLSQESESIRERQISNFHDIRNKWSIQVRNRQGDATVSRETTMKLLEEDYDRTHFVRSFDNPMEWDWESDLRVYDASDRTLQVEELIDRPNNKRFKIKFPKTLEANEEYTYTYEYDWEKLFPQEEEVYIVTGNAGEVEFEIRYPEPLEIENVRCREERQNGGLVREIAGEFKSEGMVVSGMVEKKDPMHQVHICWEVV